MSNTGVRFFVEGKTDLKFICDLVAEYFPDLQLSINADFTLLKSWSGYKSETKEFIENSDKGLINLLIIDNDVSGRRAEVEKDLVQLGIKAELFLFPDNNRVGELEHLLVDIATVRNIIDCFESYEACIKDYESVDPKGKVYAYVDALIPKADKKKDEKIIKDPLRWNYRNKDHWNLQHEALNPLLEFLHKHIVMA